ncbi:MAG: YicC/YloC family endoribonuclease [Parachlamydiales bacterium]|jgi:uncharacterized protein (TIGR00255 family)
MTGFGRASLKTKAGLLEIEIGSVNRKHFECQLFLPREWLALEIEAKKEISQWLFRGHVTLRAVFSPSEGGLSENLPAVVFLKNLKKEWEKRAEALGFDKKTVDLAFLASQTRAFSKASDLIIKKKLKEAFFQVLKKALASLMQMKEKEGRLLQKDIWQRLALVRRELLEIEAKAENSTEKYAEKLKAKLAQLGLENEERLLKEIALFAERVDITEELVRLESHLRQFEGLEKIKEPVGRKMDFLLQEMGREVNTIASKAMDVQISSAVINLKSELEKIREQVQNLE